MKKHVKIERLLKENEELRKQLEFAIEVAVRQNERSARRV